MSDFSQISGADVTRLIEQAPLCWIVPRADPSASLLMPVVVEETADTEGPATLLGHFPLRSPAAEVLATTSKASFFFLGPNSYVSPTVVGRESWGPTWNFVSARIDCAVSLDRGLTKIAVEAITRRMEGDPDWSVERMGPRAETLLSRIVGFRAQVEHTAPRFKLGQDEARPDYERIATHFDHTSLGGWMDRITKGAPD